MIKGPAAVLLLMLACVAGYGQTRGYRGLVLLMSDQSSFLN